MTNAYHHQHRGEERGQRESGRGSGSGSGSGSKEAKAGLHKAGFRGLCHSVPLRQVSAAIWLEIHAGLQLATQLSLMLAAGLSCSENEGEMAALLGKP